MAALSANDGFRRAARRAVRAAAMASAASRVDPDLVIIGVKRGGTTSLLRDIERHRSMCPLVPSAKRLPLRENQKGVHYFDTGFERGDRWYRSHFPTRATMALRRRSTGAAFTAEASPYYFFQPLAARRTAAALASAHFVVMLRDPVERTVSHWSEQTRNGVETLPLADALAAEGHRVGADAQRLLDGTIATSHAHEQQSYAAQSHYADSLQRWFDAAGRERVTVLFSEDYYRDPVAVLDVITDAIGVEPLPPAEAGTHRNAAARQTELDPDLEAALVRRFAPDVDAVAALLGTRPPWPRFDVELQRSSSDGSV